MTISFLRLWLEQPQIQRMLGLQLTSLEACITTQTMYLLRPKAQETATVALVADGLEVLIRKNSHLWVPGQARAMLRFQGLNIFKLR